MAFLEIWVFRIKNNQWNKQRQPTSWWNKICNCHGHDAQWNSSLGLKESSFSSIMITGWQVSAVRSYLWLQPPLPEPRSFLREVSLTKLAQKSYEFVPIETILRVLIISELHWLIMIVPNMDSPPPAFLRTLLRTTIKGINNV